MVASKRGAEGTAACAVAVAGDPVAGMAQETRGRVTKAEAWEEVAVPVDTVE